MDFTSKNIITTAAVTAALLPAASFLMQDSQIAYADSVEYRVVTGDYVNFRKGPSTSYASLGQLNKGDKVEYISTSDSWVKVKYNGQTGYIYAKYIAKINNETNTQVKYVNCSALNVRSGSGTSYSIITTITKDTKVEVISSSKGWSKIKVGTTTGVGTIRWKKYTIEQLIVAKLSTEQLNTHLAAFNDLKVGKMSITDFECFSNKLMYDVYKLTSDEIQYIENQQIV